MSSEEARDYFEFIAQLGMTKHYGSLKATRALVDLCYIDGASYVLDVGCGVGATPAYLVRTVGCRVVGVDLVHRMIAQARARAKQEGVAARVELAVADARRLPFADNLFDAVITESVNVFFEDKAQVVREYARVTRPGGYVGMTEMTWLKEPPPELEETFRDLVYAQALDERGWKEVLEEAGLVDVAGDAYQMDLSQESRDRLKRYGVWGIVKVLLRMVALVLGDRRARRFMGGGVGALSKDLLDVMGYGVYAGRK